jgi:methionine aminotransferase
MQIQSKLPGIGMSIFAVMTAMARRQDAINLSQGFPDFDIDEGLKALLFKYVEEGYNQYSPMPGQPALRNAIAAKVAVMHGVEVDAELEITITAGATQGIYTAIGTVISPGDSAIIFEPAYDSYAPTVRSYGGHVTPIALKAPDFGIDWEQVESTITPSTKLIIITNPHNPLGRILRDQDLRALQDIAIRHDLLVLSDEVYEHLVYDGHEHLSALRYPELRDRSFVTFSFGKTFHATGWKTGYCIAPSYLTEEFRRIHQFVTYATHTPTQLAYAEYMQDASKYLSLPVFFQEKRDRFLSLMRDSRFNFLPCEGSYFMLADYNEISDLDDMAFAEWLVKEHGVAVIPLSPFYTDVPDQKVVRFCFAKTDAVLEEAAGRLYF